MTYSTVSTGKDGHKFNNLSRDFHLDNNTLWAWNSRQYPRNQVRIDNEVSQSKHVWIYQMFCVRSMHGTWVPAEITTKMITHRGTHHEDTTIKNRGHKNTMQKKIDQWISFKLSFIVNLHIVKQFYRSFVSKFTLKLIENYSFRPAEIWLRQSFEYGKVNRKWGTRIEKISVDQETVNVVTSNQFCPSVAWSRIGKPTQTPSHR
jgi:hypothetical protein